MKQVPFSKAREQLSAILDEVQKPAKCVTIIRHGKPAAVVVGHEEFQLLQQQAKRKKKWKLAGSLIFRKSLDIDSVLERAKRERIRSLEKNIAHFAKEWDES